MSLIRELTHCTEITKQYVDESDESTAVLDALSIEKAPDHTSLRRWEQKFDMRESAACSAAAALSGLLRPSVMESPRRTANAPPEDLGRLSAVSAAESGTA